MYISYETAQFTKDNKGRFYKQYEPPKKLPGGLPKPEFMPTKLVRITDMKVVNGSQVHEGYCALSYSWNQSGEVIKDNITGKSKRVDQGKHKIITFEKAIFPDKILSFSEGHTAGISNANCTVALVPDADKCLSRDREYFKRLWTLEEAVMSRRLLFVGKNYHIWGEDIDQDDNPMHHLTKQVSELSVNEVLYHAHQRTSTKDHDRVFALIHIFPDLIDQQRNNDDHHPLKKLMNRLCNGLFSTKKCCRDKISINYDQPLEDLIIHFYGLLAKKDIKILLFSKPSYYDSTIQQFTFLPSWTGVHGQHQYYPNEIENQHPPFKIIMSLEKPFVQLQPGTKNGAQKIMKLARDYFGDYRINYQDIVIFQRYDFNEISKELEQLSRFFMGVKKKNMFWCHDKSETWHKALEVDFDNLTEDLDDPSVDYVILSEISFLNIYPVIKKKQGNLYYKATGCCSIGKVGEYVFSDCNLPKQTFSIQ
ncbi:hypothetical protein BDA99DRAFT_563104 [Phascolomyces articulosus]|uniref:Heterokaryon incompatibility domain-containing protein n=1 Tax=Phascolomyces articulosus TaxID=60185 RepID=A0AAD5JTG4_9FUNG|nr:hypothetical protein BDA99DRAFT_563104 [Phascolomyces articulosus]